MAMKHLFDAAGIVVAPGCYDALSALMIEWAGFAAAYLSGASIAYTRFARPDIGLVSMSEVADTVGVIRERTRLPLIVDADTGFGNALNVMRTVKLLAARGASAIQLEDQTMPKRCGHLAEKRLVPAAEMVGKVKAALDVRPSPEMLVIARTDAIAVEGFAAALDRAEAYREAGADMLFVEAPRDEAQVERVAKAFDAPLLYNYAPGGRSPLLPFARLRELRYAIILLPVDTLLVGVRAIAAFLGELKTRDDVTSLAERYMPFAEFNQLIGAMAMMEAADRYRDE